jgi:guanine deaminase
MPADDDFFLARAIELALRNTETGDGGPFGAVVVRDGKIIGESANQVIRTLDPTAHAEIMAIRQACATVNAFHLPESTLYASSEPCPMCLAAAYWARIDRIVFANTREEAAAIGFCDQDLYGELAKPCADRRIPTEHRHHPDALTPLQRWFTDPMRQTY